MEITHTRKIRTEQNALMETFWVFRYHQSQHDIGIFILLILKATINLPRGKQSMYMYMDSLSEKWVVIVCYVSWLEPKNMKIFPIIHQSFRFNNRVLHIRKVIWKWWKTERSSWEVFPFIFLFLPSVLCRNVELNYFF